MSIVKEEPCSPSTILRRNDMDEEVLGLHGNYLQSNVDLESSICEWARNFLFSDVQKFYQCVENEAEGRIFYEFNSIINIAELLDSDATLGNLLINHTKEFILQLRWVVFKLATEKNRLILSTASQILMNLQLTNLPTFSECIPLKRLPCKEKLVKIQGTVTSLTPVLPYTKGTKYKCSQQDICPSSDWRDMTFAWLPGASEFDLVRSRQRCRNCDAFLEEDVRLRKMGERRVFKVILSDGIRCLQPCYHDKELRYQAITVIARDGLMQEMEIGHQYWITGMIVREPLRRSASQQFFNAFIEVKRTFVKKTSIVEELPASIKSLYQDRMFSPWSFVTSLAYAFGEFISVGGSFHKLKIALLLSLVLTGNDALVEDVDGQVVIGNDLQKIHILVISEDVLMIQRLFSYASTLCDRALLSQPCLDLFGSATKHSESDGIFHVDGGSLLLAGRNVCIIPNLATLKKDESDKLCKALEEGRVLIEISKPKHAGNQSEFSQMAFALKCTVWAAAESSHGDNEIVKNGWSSIANGFDLVYDFTESRNIPDIIQEEQVAETLNMSVGFHPKFEINQEELMQFIKLAKYRNIGFSEEASKMIRSFFLASRRARNQSAMGIQIGKRSLQTMFSLAAAHAKLSLHKEVTVDDALVAIMLCEESITMTSGHSVINLQPKLHFSRDSFADSLGPKNDEMMILFHAKISAFCRTYLNGTECLYYPEE